MNSKKRKMYVPPTVEVVQLKMRNQLLTGSTKKFKAASVDDYDVVNVEDE